MIAACNPQRLWKRRRSVGGGGDVIRIFSPTHPSEQLHLSPEPHHYAILLTHSFILNIYIAPLQENYSEALPTPAWLKRAVSLPLSLSQVLFVPLSVSLRLSLSLCFSLCFSLYLCLMP